MLSLDNFIPEWITNEDFHDQLRPRGERIRRPHCKGPQKTSRRQPKPRNAAAYYRPFTVYRSKPKTSAWVGLLCTTCNHHSVLLAVIHLCSYSILPFTSFLFRFLQKKTIKSNVLLYVAHRSYFWRIPVQMKNAKHSSILKKSAFKVFIIFGKNNLFNSHLT